MNSVLFIGILISGIIAVFLTTNDKPTKDLTNKAGGTISSAKKIQPSPSPSATPATPTPDQYLKKDEEEENPVQNKNTSQYIYPNSNISSQSDSFIQMTSGDDPKQITNWYKSLFTVLGFKTKSVVTTSTNGEIQNKLAGASQELSLEIEITKKAPNNQVTIKVQIDKN